jgi:hypothetical protein
MQCILCKIYFWKVFHMYYNLICTPNCTKIFILVKSGCYSRQGEYVVILYIYSTCWHMKSVFYEHQYTPKLELLLVLEQSQT